MSVSVSIFVEKTVQHSLHQKAYVQQKVQKLWFKQVLESCDLLSNCTRSPDFFHTYTRAHSQHTSFAALSVTSSLLTLSPLPVTVHPSQEPGWLEGTLNGKTGLIPENYVEFL